MQNNEEYIQEWFEKGSNDMLTASLAFKAGAPQDTVAVLLQQAAEKYIKGYLLSKGWRLKKTHDIRELINRAIEYNSKFSEYNDLASILTSLYIEERYPSIPQSDYSREEIASLMKQTEKLIVEIKKTESK